MTHQLGEVTMALGERIKTLRKEHGWSQDDLAARIGADAGQISRYGGCKITPSVEAVLRLADTCDYLLLEDAPSRPLRGEALLADRLNDLDHLTDTDRDALLPIPIHAPSWTAPVTSQVTSSCVRYSTSAPS